MPPKPEPHRHTSDDDPLWFQVLVEFLLDVTVRLVFRGLKWVLRPFVLLIEFLFELI